MKNIVLASIRIYAVLAMKCKVVGDTFTLKNLNDGEFIDLYSDLFATFQEGANTTYRILKHIRNEFSFHFGIDELNPIRGYNNDQIR